MTDLQILSIAVIVASVLLAATFSWGSKKFRGDVF